MRHSKAGASGKERTVLPKRCMEMASEINRELHSSGCQSSTDELRDAEA
jgi:hypothetical protein